MEVRSKCVLKRIKSLLSVNLKKHVKCKCFSSPSWGLDIFRVYRRYLVVHEDEEGCPERDDKKEEQQQNLSEEEIIQHALRWDVVCVCARVACCVLRVRVRVYVCVCLVK